VAFVSSSVGVGGGIGDGRVGMGWGEKMTHDFCYFGGGVILHRKLLLVDVRVRRRLVLVALRQMAAQTELVGFSGVLRLN
jgi:hypothetical protein